MARSALAAACLMAALAAVLPGAIASSGVGKDPKQIWDKGGPLLLDPLYTDSFSYYYDGSAQLINTKTGSQLDQLAGKNLTEYLGLDKDVDMMDVRKGFIEFVENGLGIKFAEFGVDWSKIPYWLGQIRASNLSKPANVTNPFGLPDIIVGYWIIKPEANMRMLHTTLNDFNDERCKYRPTWGFGYALVPLFPINANGPMYKGPFSQTVEGYAQWPVQVVDCVSSLKPYVRHARLIVHLKNQVFPSFQGTKAGLIPTSYDVDGVLIKANGQRKPLKGYAFGVTKQNFDQFGLTNRIFHTTVLFNGTRDQSQARSGRYSEAGFPLFTNDGADDPNLLAQAIGAALSVGH